MLRKLLTALLPADAGLQEKLFFVLNYSIPVFMGIYIFANPLPLASINEICFYISCAALLTLLIFRKTDFTLRTPLTMPFALFALWAILGLFFTLDLRNSLHDLRGHLLEYLIVFYLLVNFFKTRKRLEILSLIFIAGATVFAVGGVITYYLIEGHPFTDRMGYTFKEMHTAWIGYITISASILAVLHFHRYPSWLYKSLFGACFVINVAVTFLTQTRSSLIGLAAALVILCFANKKNLILFLVVALLLVFVPGMKSRIDERGFTKDIRSKMYRLTVEVIKDYPIAGIGFGMEIYGNPQLIPLDQYNLQLPPEHRQRKTLVASPHSTFLDIAVRTGLVGLMLFMYILLSAVWMLWKIFIRDSDDDLRSWAIYLFAGFTSFVLASIFADAMYGPRVVVFYTTLAMITILWNLAFQSRQTENVGQRGCKKRAINHV